MAKGIKTGGRQKGSANKRTLEIARQAMEKGITPIEVMLEAMREAYDAWKRGEINGEPIDAEAQAKLAAVAVLAAEKAAPYIHPKLSSVESKVEASVRQTVVSDKPLTETEWQQQYSPTIQ